MGTNIFLNSIIGDYFAAGEIRSRSQGVGHLVQLVRRQRRRRQVVAKQHRRLFAARKEPAAPHRRG